MHNGHDMTAHSHAGHGGHDHGAMVADFRRRFWISLIITIPVLALSPLVQSIIFPIKFLRGRFERC
jgi:Cu2+-exporting ATPase